MSETYINIIRVSEEIYDRATEIFGTDHPRAIHDFEIIETTDDEDIKKLGFKAKSFKFLTLDKENHAPKAFQDNIKPIKVKGFRYYPYPSKLIFFKLHNDKLEEYKELKKEDGNTFFLGFSFQYSEIGKLIISQFNRQLITRLNFLKFDLNGILRDLSSGDLDYVALKRAEFVITGKNNDLRTLSLSGNNVLKTDSIKKFEDTSINAWTLRLHIDPEHGWFSKATIEFDRYGNYKCGIGSFHRFRLGFVLLLQRLYPFNSHHFDMEVPSKKLKREEFPEAYKTNNVD